MLKKKCQHASAKAPSINVRHNKSHKPGIKMLSRTLQSISCCFLSIAALVQGQSHSPAQLPVRRQANETAPTKWAGILFEGMLLQDLIGVIDPLQVMARSTHLELVLLAETLDMVSTMPPASVSANTYNSSWWPGLTPTHTFATAPDDIEVLIVPGGPGMRDANLTAAATDYIRDVYPSLRYLVTVCTGAGLAARAGVLDGRRATTNKLSWDTITAMGPNVEWVSPARWVVDGNIWTSSGVTAGIDLVFALIEYLWGEAESERIAGIEEYVPHPQDFDPFAAMYNVTPTYNVTA